MASSSVRLPPASPSHMAQVAVGSAASGSSWSRSPRNDSTPSPPILGNELRSSSSSWPNNRSLDASFDEESELAEFTFAPFDATASASGNAEAAAAASAAVNAAAAVAASSSMKRSQNSRGRRAGSASALAAWSGSAYLCGGTMLSRTDAPSPSDGIDPSVLAAERVARHAAAAAAGAPAVPSRRRGFEEDDGRQSPRLEHIPTHIMAPIFPFMGDDGGLAQPPSASGSGDDSDGFDTADVRSSPVGAGSSTLGGWSSSARARRHDRPLLRFLPGDAAADQYAHVAVSNDVATAVAAAASSSSSGAAPQPLLLPRTLAQRSRRRPDASPERDAGAEASPSASPPAPIPRACSARSDPNYSPALLRVTDRWWRSCEASNFLLHCAPPVSGTNVDSPAASHPPLLCHDPYVRLRMLVFMALLPPAAFEHDRSRLALLAEQEFRSDVEQAQVDLLPPSALASPTSISSSPPSVPLGLTLPMFHTSLCSLARFWSGASSLPQCALFLENLLEAVSEAPSTEERTEGQNAVASVVQDDQNPNTERVEDFDPSESSSHQHHKRSASSNDVLGNLPNATGAPPSPTSLPRKFHALPPVVLSALHVAEQEATLDRARQAAAAHSASEQNRNSLKPRGANKRRVQRSERLSFRAAMGPKASELLRQRRHSGGAGGVQFVGGGGATTRVPSIKQQREQAEDEAAAAAAARARKLRKQERKAAKLAALLARKQAQLTARRAAEAQQQAEAEAAALVAAESEDDDVDAVPEDVSDSDSTHSLEARQASAPSSNDGSARYTASSDRERASRPTSSSTTRTPAVASMQQQPLPPPASARKYASGADIRRSAREGIGAAANGTSSESRGSTPLQDLPISSSSSPQPLPSPQRRPRGSPTVLTPRGSGASLGLAAGAFPSSRAVNGRHNLVASGADSESGSGGSWPPSAGDDFETIANARSRSSSDISQPNSNPAREWQAQPPQEANSSAAAIAAASAKAARLLKAQQAAALHRARISAGRTHSGHVLPAYILGEEASSTAVLQPALIQPQQVLQVAPITTISAAPLLQERPPVPAVSATPSIIKPGGYTFGASSRIHNATVPVAGASSGSSNGASPATAAAVAAAHHVQRLGVASVLSLGPHVGAPPSAGITSQLGTSTQASAQARRLREVLDGSNASGSGSGGGISSTAAVSGLGAAHSSALAQLARMQEASLPPSMQHRQQHSAAVAFAPHSFASSGSLGRHSDSSAPPNKTRAPPAGSLWGSAASAGIKDAHQQHTTPPIVAAGLGIGLVGRKVV